MVALNDVSMEGVTPGGGQELPAGNYVLRVENSERKQAKDKMDENTGQPHPDNGKNFYLQLDSKVYGGTHNGQVDFERLNLWNTNATAVNIAKSTLKSIFLATGVEASDSKELHGKWLHLEVKADSKGNLKKHYHKLDPNLIPANAPPIAVTVAATPAPAQAVAASAAAPATEADSRPLWAR